MDKRKYETGVIYTAAQEELKRILIEQQTISVPKLQRLLNALNVSLHPDKTPESVEIAYLKGEIRKREKKMAFMGQKIKELQTGKRKGQGNESNEII